MLVVCGAGLECCVCCLQSGLFTNTRVLAVLWWMPVADEADEEEAKLEALNMYEEAIDKAVEECYGEEDEDTQNEMNAIIEQLKATAEELRSTFTSGNTVHVTVDMVVPDDCVAGEVVEVEVEGELVDVTIPEGLNPGDEFEITVEVEAATPTPAPKRQPKRQSKPPAPAAAPAPSPSPPKPANVSAATSTGAIPEGTPPQARYESYGERSIKALLVQTDLVKEKKTMVMDVKDLSAAKRKIAERILFPQSDAEHLKIFSLDTNADVTTLDDLGEKVKLQVTVAADFMPTSSAPASAVPLSDPETPRDAASTEVEASAEVAASPTSSTLGKRNLLLFLIETDIVKTQIKFKAEGVTTLDELRAIIVEKANLGDSCSLDQLEIYSTLSKMDVTDLSHLKDKDKIKVTAAVEAGEPEPTTAHDFEAARPYLAEMFGWLGTHSRQCVCKSCPFPAAAGTISSCCVPLVVGRILICPSRGCHT